MIGAENIAAAAWHVPARWFENTGHWVYVEQPEGFALAACAFFADGTAPSQLTGRVGVAD